MSEQLRLFDVCIIGSGPAGAFAASVIARNGYSVAVVEAGGSLVDFDPGNVIDVQASSISGRVKLGFSQQIGGSSNLWAGFVARLNAVDFVERPEFNALGWPISLGDLDPYYTRVNDYFGIRWSEDEERPSLISAFSAIKAHETILLEPPFATSKLVREQAGLHLLDNSPAHRLIWEPGVSSIRELELLDLKSGRLRRLRARKFVIAAGALTNTRLLLHSLAERKATLPKIFDLIGRGFSTHPKAWVGAIKLNRPLPWDHPLISLERSATHSRLYQFGLDEHVLLDKGLLNHCLRFHPPFHNRLHRAFEYAKRLAAKAPLVRGGKGALVDQFARFGRQAYVALEKITPPGAPPDWLAARLFLDQAVRPENRVTLSSCRSPSGLPLAVLNWAFTEDDWRSVEAFLDAFGMEVRRLGIGSFTFTRPAQHKFTAVHSHFLGGTPMGRNPDASVLNADLQVHGVDNLYVSGPSAFPSYGYANPFYTVAALSIRLGDHLTMTLNKEKTSAQA